MNNNNIKVSQIGIKATVFFHLPMFSLFYFLHFRERDSFRMNISRAVRRNADVGAVELPSYMFGVSTFESSDAENYAPSGTKTGPAC
jgi:hypothetical protein